MKKAHLFVGIVCIVLAALAFLLNRKPAAASAS